MLKKVLIFALLTSVILTQTSFGSDFDNMSDYEKAQAAGVYIEEIMKYINDNYMGEKEVSIEKLMQTAIRAIAKDLDEYSDYLSPEEYKEIKEAEQKVWYAPDFVCAFNEDGYPEITEVKQGSKAYQTGLREGNFIKSISDISAYGIGEEEYNTLVTKSDSNSITMKIATNASTVVEMNIPLVSIDNSTVITHDVSKAGKGAEEVKFDDKTVGYIKITSFSYKTDAEFEKAMNSLLKQGCTKLILDLRGNTGGYVEPAIKIAQMIVPQGLIITARDKNGNGENYVSNLKVTPFKKYAVLVDSSTASASEILASAMQDSGIATIVGEQTFGKGVMQSVMDFDDAGVIKMTTQEYTTRNGNKINNVGITPDINVHKIMFVTEGEDVSSSNVTAAMRFLGFKVDNKNPIEKAIGSYQSEMHLPVTRVLDKETVNAINLEIYDDMINNDRVLTAGYISILS